jgi:hypothetical protein
MMQHVFEEGSTAEADVQRGDKLGLVVQAVGLRGI